MMINKREGRVAFGMSSINFLNSREGFIARAHVPDRFNIGIQFYQAPNESDKDHTYSKSDLRQLREAINLILEGEV